MAYGVVKCLTSSTSPSLCTPQYVATIQGEQISDHIGRCGMQIDHELCEWNMQQGWGGAGKTVLFDLVLALLD